MRASDEMILREIAGEYILIPIGRTALKIHGMISLSESGLLLWKKLQKECTQEELVKAILEEYDVEYPTAKADVEEFIHRMDEVGLLIQ